MACHNLPLGTFKLNSVFNPFEPQTIKDNGKARLVEKCQKAITLRGRKFYMYKDTPMTNKIIILEEQEGQFQVMLQRVIRMVPDKDKSDKNLQRLLAFRLKIDGEAATSEYLIRKAREIIQCSYTGSFYEFIKNDAVKRECGSHLTMP